MRSPLDTLRREDGVTIVELLVVCLIGIVVLSAAAGLTESSARSSARVTDEVEVAQRARLAMEQITRQLRSQVCLDTATPPIADGQDASITFYNEIDSNPDFSPKRQRISYSPASGGSIVQESWTTTSTGPPWSFPEPRKSKVLLTNVGQLPGQPIFRYYTFDSAGALTAPLDATLLTPIAPNSTARVVRVEVSFEALPTGGSTEQSRRSGLRSSVYLRNTDHSDGDPAATRTWGPRCD